MKTAISTVVLCPNTSDITLTPENRWLILSPCLRTKSLTMCQDVTPNTSEGKEMMYAITWNEDGTRLVQVGISPKRLLEETKQNEISTVVAIYAVL